jgi:hypothetical protein
MDQPTTIWHYVLALAVGIPFLIIFWGSIYLAARDAAARGKSAGLVALLVFFTWPIGLIMWVIFRPDNEVH